MPIDCEAVGLERIKDVAAGAHSESTWLTAEASSPLNAKILQIVILRQRRMHVARFDAFFDGISSSVHMML
jgi:hypothetical protein